MFFNDRVFFTKETDGSRQATFNLHRSLLEKEVVRLKTRLELEIELRRLLEAALGYGDKLLLESSQMKQEIPVETSDLVSDVLWLESTVSSLEAQACELREQIGFARTQRETLATRKFMNESRDTRSLTLEAANLDDIKTKLSSIEAATKVHCPPSDDTGKPVSSASSQTSSSSSNSRSSNNSSANAKNRRPLLPKSTPLDNCSSSSSSSSADAQSRRPLLPRSTPLDNTYSVKRQQVKSRTPAPSYWTSTRPKSSSTSSSPSSSSKTANLFSGKLYASVDVPNVAYLLKNQTKHTANRIIKSLALPSYRRREQSKSLDAGAA